MQIMDEQAADSATVVDEAVSIFEKREVRSLQASLAASYGNSPCPQRKGCHTCLDGSIVGPDLSCLGSWFAVYLLQKRLHSHAQSSVWLPAVCAAGH